MSKICGNLEEQIAHFLSRDMRLISAFIGRDEIVLVIVGHSLYESFTDALNFVVVA